MMWPAPRSGLGILSRPSAGWRQFIGVTCGRSSGQRPYGKSRDMIAWLSRVARARGGCLAAGRLAPTSAQYEPRRPARSPLMERLATHLLAPKILGRNPVALVILLL